MNASAIRVSSTHAAKLCVDLVSDCARAADATARWEIDHRTDVARRQIASIRAELDELEAALSAEEAPAERAVA